MTSNLETLLFQLRDGPTDAAVLARARALAVDDERIPADLREFVLVDPAEAPSDAAGLLAVLGVDDLGAALSAEIYQSSDSVLRHHGSSDSVLQSVEEVTDAMLAEVDAEWAPIGASLREGLAELASSVELADVVLRRLPLADFAWGPVLSEAVAREAGVVDVTAAVHASLRTEGGPGLEWAPVAAAVHAEAGGVELADLVCAALGLPAHLPVSSAVHAEAGSVELADDVLTSVGLALQLPLGAAVRAEAGAVDLADQVLAAIGAGRSAIAPNPVRLPPPANNLRWFAAGVLSIAAAVLATVTAAQLTGGPGAPAAMLFAHAGDVVIEDLSYGDNVQVLQIEGDDGAVILWVDEEV
ncbi:MAG: hypothetical protein ABMA64_22775 [Myxococcota bacterium]